MWKYNVQFSSNSAQNFAVEQFIQYLNDEFYLVLQICFHAGKYMLIIRC